MPKFSGLAALALLQESGLDLPFIIVSGNIGEDIAVRRDEGRGERLHHQGQPDQARPGRGTGAARRQRSGASGSQTEDQLNESRQRLFETLENMNEGFFTLDHEWRFTYVNTEASKLWRKRPRRTDRTEASGTWRPAAVGTIFGSEYHRAVQGADNRSASKPSRPAQGIWVEVRAYPSDDGLVVYFHDITDRKKSQEQITRLTRLYSVLSKVNEAIIRIHEPEDTVPAGLPHRRRGRRLQDGLDRPDRSRRRAKCGPVASYGDSGGYLDDIKVYRRWTFRRARAPRAGRSPRETMSSARHRTRSDHASLARQGPAARFPVLRGLPPAGPARRSSALFTIYGANPQFFTDEETTLLTSLAEDVSFALDAMANEKKRKAAEQRTELMNALLGLFTRKVTRHEYLDAACTMIRDWSGFQHVGIRIEDPDRRIPFESCEGYNEAFLEEEGNLSLAHDHCICTRVIAGTPEPPDRAAMTPNGSFYSGDTTAFLSCLDQEQRTRYRGVCMRYGFNSLAVVPIRYRETPIGAIHLADERQGLAPRTSVVFLEQLAHIIGEAVFRFGIEDELRANYASLQKTSELLEKIFSTTHMLVVYLDRDFNFIRVNRAYAKAENNEPGYFIGRNYFDLCPDEALKGVFRQVVETGEPYFATERPFEYAGSHPGRTSYWDWSLLPVREADGMVSGLVFTLVDVTDRRSAEEKLREANAYNRNLIESSLDPLVTIGSDGTITDVNAATEMATGFLREELIGTDFSEYFTEPDKARAGYQQVFREGKVMDYALEIRHRSGGQRRYCTTRRCTATTRGRSSACSPPPATSRR